jgi:hypothetical protein
MVPQNLQADLFQKGPKKRALLRLKPPSGKSDQTGGQILAIVRDEKVKEQDKSLKNRLLSDGLRTGSEDEPGLKLQSTKVKSELI